MPTGVVPALSRRLTGKQQKNRRFSGVLDIQGRSFGQKPMSKAEICAVILVVRAKQSAYPRLILEATPIMQNIGDNSVGEIVLTHGCNDSGVSFAFPQGAGHNNGESGRRSRGILMGMDDRGVCDAFKLGMGCWRCCDAFNDCPGNAFDFLAQGIAAINEIAYGGGFIHSYGIQAYLRKESKVI